LLFPALNFIQLLIFATQLFCLFHGLYFFVVFNGGKPSSYRDVPRSQHVSVLYSPHIFISLRVALSFVASQYFNRCRVALFPRLRQDSLFPPKCRRSALHDIYDCTAMPIF